MKLDQPSQTSVTSVPSVFSFPAGTL